MADKPMPLLGKTSDGDIVSVEQFTPRVLTQIAGWANFAQASDAALRRLLLHLPEDYRTPVRHGADVVWRIAPTKVLVSSAVHPDVSDLPDFVALDLSDARTGVILHGPGAAGLLARLAAIDFSERSFPSGSFVQTGIHHVGVLIDRLSNDRFDLLIPTTWADTLLDLIGCHLGSADA